MNRSPALALALLAACDEPGSHPTADAAGQAPAADARDLPDSDAGDCAPPCGAGVGLPPPGPISHDVMTPGTTAVRAALAADNRVHVVWNSGGALRYAWWDGIQWFDEPIGEGGRFAVSLALDPDGRPHVLYVDDPDDGRLIHAWKQGVGWQREPVADLVGPTNNVVDHSFDLAIDGAGTLHAAFVVLPEVRYARKAPGGPWAPGPALGLGTAIDLALDASGRLHLASVVSGAIALRIVEGDLVSERPALPAARPTEIDLEVAGDGAAHLLYRDLLSATSLHHAALPTASATWFDLPLVDQAEARAAGRLALSSLGYPHVVYSPGDRGPVHLGESAGTWQATPVLAAGDRFVPAVELLLDDADRAHVFYVESELGPNTLAYADVPAAP